MSKTHFRIEIRYKEKWRKPTVLTLDTNLMEATALYTSYEKNKQVETIHLSCEDEFIHYSYMRMRNEAGEFYTIR
jgi:hypothetical protein